MSAFETIMLERREGVAWVTLNRPRVLNAYNITMRDELYQALGLITEDPDVRVACFRGAGDRAFCSGADLTEFGSAPSQFIARQVRFERDVWARLLGSPKPLIAAIHGFCLGSGLEIAFCCDVRIASPEARFGLPETGLGMIPAAAGTQTLPRIVGISRALATLLLGRQIDAQEALRVGLVTRSAPRERLFDEAHELATALVKTEPHALRLAKEAIARGLDTSLDHGLEIESAAVRRLAALRAA